MAVSEEELELARHCQAKMDRSDLNFFTYVGLAVTVNGALLALVKNGETPDPQALGPYAIAISLVNTYCALGAWNNWRMYTKSVRWGGTIPGPAGRVFRAAFNDNLASSRRFRLWSTYRVGTLMAAAAAGFWVGVFVSDRFGLGLAIAWTCGVLGMLPAMRRRPGLDPLGSKELPY